MEIRRIDASPLAQASNLLSKDQFELAYRRTQDEGGHSYDPFTIAWCWKDYQSNPDKYNWLKV